jgi:hypothetical protein
MHCRPIYLPHVIHSTAHPEKAWVIRVTGTDLDHLPRFRFHPQRDKIVTRYLRRPLEGEVLVATTRPRAERRMAT